MIDLSVLLTVLLALAIAALSLVILMGAVGLIWFIVSIPYLVTNKLKYKDK